MLLLELEADAVEACKNQSLLSMIKTHPLGADIPAPGRPTIVLLLPMRTFAVPLMTPWTKTTVGVVFFSPAAAVNWASVDTVVVVPPEPPVVLSIFVSVSF